MLNTTVDPEKEDNYPQGPLVADWAQIYKQSPAAIDKQGRLRYATLQGETCIELLTSRTEQSAL